MLELEDGERSFWMEFYSPSYIVEDFPSLDSAIIGLQLFFESEKISRFLHVYGSVLALSVFEFKHWLGKILFEKDKPSEFDFDPGLNFKYLGLVGSKHHLSIELAFIDPEQWERFNFCPYPKEVFKDDEFEISFLIDEATLANEIANLSKNFRTELEALTEQNFDFL